MRYRRFFRKRSRNDNKSAIGMAIQDLWNHVPSRVAIVELQVRYDGCKRLALPNDGLSFLERVDCRDRIAKLS